MADVVGYAVDRLWRDELLDATNEAYAVLRGRDAEWRTELEERAVWEQIEHWKDK